MHYYQHNIGDYARDTSHLSALEHGIYRLLLDWCYLNEKPLSTELAIRLGRGNPDETHSVLSGFFTLENDGWVHKRVQKEVEAYHAKAEQNRKNGVKGGRKTQKEPRSNPVGSQSGGESNPNPLTKEPINPITNIEIPSGISKAQAPKQKASKRCPADFVVTRDMVDWAVENRITVDLNSETDKFRDHEYKTSKTDWVACWRTWMRNAQQYARGSPAIGKQQALEDHNDAVAAQFIKDLENGKRTIGGY
jgi:uncharacterized protein YdaU (DUF1376 family)